MLVFTVQKNGSFLKTSVCFSGRLVYYSLAPRNRRLCLFFFLQMEVKTYRAKAKSYVMNQLRLIEVTTRRLTNPCMTWKFYFRGLVAGRLSPDSVSTQSVLHYDWLIPATGPSLKSRFFSKSLGFGSLGPAFATLSLPLIRSRLFLRQVYSNHTSRELDQSIGRISLVNKHFLGPVVCTMKQ